VIDLPGGQVKEVALPNGTLSRVSRPGHVLIAPVDKFVMGMFDLEKQQVVAGFTSRAADVFGDMYASERAVGDVGLFAIEGNKLQRSLVLPAPLLSVRLGAVSPDLRWLTASGSTRAAIWDTTKGQLLGWMSDYFGAFIDEATGTVYADPATGNWRRSIMRFDVNARKYTPGAQLSRIAKPFSSRTAAADDGASTSGFSAAKQRRAPDHCGRLSAGGASEPGRHEWECSLGAGCADRRASQG